MRASSHQQSHKPTATQANISKMSQQSHKSHILSKPDICEESSTAAASADTDRGGGTGECPAEGAPDTKGFAEKTLED